VHVCCSALLLSLTSTPACIYVRIYIHIYACVFQRVCQCGGASSSPPILTKTLLLSLMSTPVYMDERIYIQINACVLQCVRVCWCICEFLCVAV